MKIRATGTYRRDRGEGVATPPNVYDEPAHVVRRAVETGRAEVVQTERIAEIVEEHTKEELYAMAQEADIPGRSSMNEPELAAHLAEVE